MTLRVGITPDVLNAAGEPIWGKGPYALLDHPGIEWEYVAKAEPAAASVMEKACSRSSPLEMSGR